MFKLPDPKYIPYVVTAIALIGAVLVPAHLNSRLASATAAAESARIATVAALDSAARLERIAADVRQQAKADSARADSAEAHAAAIEQRAAVRTGSYEQAARQAPDTCRVVIAAADSALATKDSTVTALHSALDLSHKAEADLTAALDTTALALKRVQDAAVPLTKAVTVLEKASHPSFFTRLVPRVGPGAAAGIDAYGKPNITYGIALSWSF